MPFEDGFLITNVFRDLPEPLTCAVCQGTIAVREDSLVCPTPVGPKPCCSRKCEGILFALAHPWQGDDTD